MSWNCRFDRYLRSTASAAKGYLARLLFPLLLFASMGCAAEAGRLQVLGYGVNSCAAYLQQFSAWERGEEAAIVEYLRYRAWFTGLVTGLSLATGTDVLQGLEVEGAMRRLQVYCSEHRTEDFFVASMDLIRTLSRPG